MSARREPKPPRHPLNPRIAGVRLSVLAAHYRARLRRQLAGELLAGAGIAVGVALVFGVLLASSSITGSAPALIRAVNGKATLELRARSGEGIGQAVAERAGRVPGVRYAAFVLRENAQLIGAHGRRSIQLVGVSSDIVALHSHATQSLGAGAALLNGGIGLPAPLSRAVGAHAGRRVTLLAAGDAHNTRVRVVLNSATVGPVAQEPIAIAQLGTAQRLSAHPGRVSEVLIEPRHGARRRVASELRRLLGARVDVVPAGRELQVLQETARPLGESTGLFAAIGAMVGLLFVANAMLLTLPDRRRLLAELHTQGFEPRQIVAILIFQALVLGLVASVAGLALGDLLAHTILHQSPVYLAAAFPIESNEAVHLGTLLIALAGGILAAVLASLPPIAEMLRGPLIASAAEQPLQRIGRHASRALGLMGAGLLIAVTAIVIADPGLTIVGGILLAIAVPCLIPALFAVALTGLKRLGRRVRGSMLSLAAIELNATAARSVALIGVAAVAVYGSVAVQGARSDLSTGLDQAVVEFLDTAQVWVSADNNFLTIDSFRPGGATAAIAGAPGVASVRVYEGGLLDVGSRRLWIRARSPQDSRMLQASQLLQGDLSRAEARIRDGGWAAVSGGFAAERDLHVGEHFTLPTPTGPARFGVAAITTNVGWAPGAITIGLADYRRRWRSSRPAALEVSLKRGVSPAAGAAAVRRALKGRAGLQVQTAAQRERVFEASAREGLRSLGQISTLLLITAALAVAAVLSASIWRRRGRLASLKAHGFEQMQLWRALVAESALAVAIGCADGAIIGLYGHALASRWLGLSTGFPAPFSVGIQGILLALAIVAGITVIIVGALGLHSARVAPDVAFQDQLA